MRSVKWINKIGAVFAILDRACAVAINYCAARVCCGTRRSLHFEDNDIRKGLAQGQLTMTNASLTVADAPRSLFGTAASAGKQGHA